MTRRISHRQTISRRTLLARACAAVPAAMLLSRAMAAETKDAKKFAVADEAIEAAVAAGQIPGAVLCVGRKGGIEYLRAYGNRAVEPAAVQMTDDTIFDLASLSKPIGTATLVMTLIEQGKVAVTDRVAKYLPPFAANGKADVTVEQLLLHRGGVIPDLPLKDYVGTREEMVKRTLETQLSYEPGTKVVYSDVGFITLGELAASVAGKPQNVLADEIVFKPLGMKDSGYNPAEPLKARCAPTEKREGRWMIGEVHDPRAYAMGGVAGHAGVFATATDVSRYCRMFLGNGELEGTRVLKPETVADMTKARALPDGSGVRNYGFDVNSSFSAPRGERFPIGKSFGHTGFTGTSLWIDPVDDVFVILLTNSVHPANKGRVSGLRRTVGTAVANVMLPEGAGEPPKPPETGGGNK